MTDEQISAVVLEHLRRYKDGGAWQALTRDVGPYEITVLRPFTLELARALIAAAGVTAPAKPPLPADATIHGKFVHYRNSSGGITTADIDAFAVGVPPIHETQQLSPGQQQALERQRRLVATLPQTREQAAMLTPCLATGHSADPTPRLCGHCGKVAAPGGTCAYGVNTPDGEQR